MAVAKRQGKSPQKQNKGKSKDWSRTSGRTNSTPG